MKEQIGDVMQLSELTSSSSTFSTERAGKVSAADRGALALFCEELHRWT